MTLIAAAGLLTRRRGNTRDGDLQLGGALRQVGRDSREGFIATVHHAVGTAAHERTSWLSGALLRRPFGSTYREREQEKRVSEMSEWRTNHHRRLSPNGIRRASRSVKATIYRPGRRRSILGLMIHSKRTLMRAAVNRAHYLDAGRREPAENVDPFIPIGLRPVAKWNHKREPEHGRATRKTTASRPARV